MRKITAFTLCLLIIGFTFSCGPKVSKRCKKDAKNIKALRKRGMMM